MSVHNLGGATHFEYRHQTLLHLLLVGLAVSTYFVTRDDVVWALVRHHSNSAFLEQLAFGAGTIMLLSCAALETWARAHTQPGIPLFQPLLVSRLLFALVLGLLVPLAGTIVIIAGEALLAFRLFVRDRDRATSTSPPSSVHAADAKWGEAFRQAAAKWGFAASMIVFTLTLRDRIAEIGGGVSFLIWAALNLPRFVRSHDS
jgi:hypothetical protein